MKRHSLNGREPPGRRSTDITLRSDPLRSARLHPPYYGVPALEHISIATLLRADSRAELAARIRERERELLSMCALLNSSAPINHLPTELLVEVFMQLQGGDDGLDWLHVLQVCRHWFVVGSMAATLWRNLHVNGNTNLLRTGLARSRVAELNVEVKPHNPHLLLEVAGLIAPHMHRLRSLKLGPIPMPCLPIFTDFMHSYMPALRSLHVLAVASDGPDLLLDLSPTQLPRLQELDTFKFHVFGNMEIFSQLQKVNVGHCYGSNPALKTMTLVDAVRNMENVRELCIRDVYVSDIVHADDGTDPMEDKVVLSRLQHVVVNTDGPLIKALLRAVVIPLTATVSLTSPFFGECEEGCAPDFRAVVPEDRGCLPVLSKIVAAVIRSTFDVHSLEGYTTLDARPHVSLRIEIPYDDTEEEDAVPVGLGDLAYVFRDAPLASVTVETTFGVMVETDWRGLLAPFPTVGALNLVVAEDEDAVPADRVFRALDPGEAAAAAADVKNPDAREPLQGTPRAHGVLCPNLQSLCLYAHWEASEELLAIVATCLENRRRALGWLEGRLARLVLDMDGHHDKAEFLAMRSAYIERLAPLVDDVVYQSSDDWSSV